MVLNNRKKHWGWIFSALLLGMATWGLTGPPSLHAGEYGLYEGSITEWIYETEKAKEFIIDQFTEYLAYKHEIPRRKVITTEFSKVLYQCIESVVATGKLPPNTPISKIVESCTFTLMKPPSTDQKSKSFNK